MNDYLEKNAQKPLAILLLSDGDSTNDLAKADYDDISFLPLDLIDDF